MPIRYMNAYVVDVIWSVFAISLASTWRLAIEVSSPPSDLIPFRVKCPHKVFVLDCRLALLGKVYSAAANQCLF